MCVSLLIIVNAHDVKMQDGKKVKLKNEEEV